MMDRKLALIIQFAAADKLSGSMRKIIGLGEKGTTTLARMKREARELDNQLRAAQRATAAKSGNVTALLDEERRLERAIAGANRQIERQKGLIAIDNKAAALQTRGSALKSTGMDNMIGGAGLITPFVLAGREAMNFSSGMVDIQLKAQLTNREMLLMQKRIMAAARAAHQLPEDMRGAVDVLAGFGMDPRQAVMLTQPIGRLGTAFKVDLSDAASSAYTGINNLKIPIGQVSSMFDIMAAAGNAGAFEVKDMARWFPAITAQSRALGQSGLGAAADLSAAMQIARRSSADAEEAGNNIVNLLQKINSPETIRKFSKNFGVDLPAAMHRAYAQGKTPLEAIAELSAKATGGNLEKLGSLFEDRQAASALRSLILDMKDYRQIRADIARSGGVVDSAFKTREINDASIMWKAFREQLGETGVTLGTTVLPSATRFFAVVNSMLGGVNRWAQANPRLASTLFTLVGGLAAARIGLGALQFALGGMLGPMATLWKWGAKFRTWGGFATLFSKIAGSQGVGFLVRGLTRLGPLFLRGFTALGPWILRGAVAAFGLLSNPVGWALLAAGAALLVWKYWGTIKATWNSIDWGNLGRKLISGIAFGVGYAWTGLKNWWQGQWPALIAYVKSLSWRDVGMWIADAMTLGLASKLSAINWGGVIKGAISAGTSGFAAGSAAAGGSSKIAGKRALGGPVMAGQTYLVGERGPELFTARASGQITPNSRLRAGHASNDNRRSSPPVVLNITINQQPGENAEALARRVAQLIERNQRLAQRRSYADG